MRFASSLLAALVLAGCASLEGDARNAGFERLKLAAGAFELLAYRRHSAGEDTLTVYMESDGAAWHRRDAPPADPTPRQPLALRLALADPGGAVAWLSRPCQFLAPEALAGCDSRYWRRARYSEEVVVAMDQAVTRLLRESGARRLVLVGHSGGGAIAALVAARRQDVAALVTVGGVLDTLAWTRHHGVSVLDASLNPADFAQRLSGVRQVHYVGVEDEITPPALAEAFALRAGRSARAERVAGRGHDCCWVNDWAQRILPFRENRS